MTLTFDILTPKPNQYISEPKYICDQEWVKFPSLVFNVRCSRGFWDAQTHALTHRHTDPNTLCLQHRFSAVAESLKLGPIFNQKAAKCRSHVLDNRSHFCLPCVPTKWRNGILISVMSVCVYLCVRKVSEKRKNKTEHKLM